jgi:hypothetical protein
MYFTILIGAMNLLRWVVCAANCALRAQQRTEIRTEFSDVRIRGTLQF